MLLWDGWGLIEQEPLSERDLELLDHLAQTTRSDDADFDELRRLYQAEAGLLREVAARGVCFDVCPTSNVKLGVVPTLEQHPLPALLAEYNHARTTLGLHDAQLADIARASLRSSGAPGPLRDRALTGVDGWLATSP
jgi:adenosine deaminase